MTSQDIQNELIDFGFVDITAQRYEIWKKQKVFRHGHSFYVIFDEPNVELFKDATQCDYTIGITQAQIRGLLAFLKLSYNDRRTIKYKILHLPELYQEIKDNPFKFEQIAYKRFTETFEKIELKYLKTNEYLVISE